MFSDLTRSDKLDIIHLIFKLVVTMGLLAVLFYLLVGLHLATESQNLLAGTLTTAIIGLWAQNPVKKVEATVSENGPNVKTS